MPETKWYHNVWAVLLGLFVVLGPLGLPLLWKSPRFSKPWKWILTALTLLYTIWILRMTLSVTEKSLQILSGLASY